MFFVVVFFLPPHQRLSVSGGVFVYPLSTHPQCQPAELISTFPDFSLLACGQSWSRVSERRPNYACLPLSDCLYLATHVCMWGCRGWLNCTGERESVCVCVVLCVLAPLATSQKKKKNTDPPPPPPRILQPATPHIPPALPLPSLYPGGFSTAHG